MPVAGILKTFVKTTRRVEISSVITGRLEFSMLVKEKLGYFCDSHKNTRNFFDNHRGTRDFYGSHRKTRHFFNHEDTVSVWGGGGYIFQSMYRSRMFKVA